MASREQESGVQGATWQRARFEWLLRGFSALLAVLRRPYLTRRTAQGIIAVLLVAKLGATVYNAAVADSAMYDKAHHLQRAESLGFELGRRYYNPPLYYMPLGLVIEQPSIIPAKKAPRIRAIINYYRGTNIVYLAVFYVCWLFVIFPAALPSWRSSFLASLLLLSLPGYQRLAKFVHPDNLLSALTALAFALWILAERRTRSGESRSGESRSERKPLGWKWVLGIAVTIGLTGATRPFSVVPVVVFSLASVWLLVYRQQRPWRQLFTKGLAAGALIAVLSGSWWGYRLVALPSGLTDVYFGTKRYGPYRPTFDWQHYFTSFYLEKLLERPNREYRDFDRSSAKLPTRRSFFFNQYSNSFFTLLYSDVWADHWLYFSGPGKQEYRAEEKRRILLFALAPTLILALMGVGQLARVGYRAARKRCPGAAQSVLLALMAAGLALYLQWQTGDALKPGKQSTVKFIYIAYCLPAVVALPFLSRLRGLAFNILAVMLGLLFVVAFPMSVALSQEYMSTHCKSAVTRGAAVPDDDDDE